MALWTVFGGERVSTATERRLTRACCQRRAMRWASPGRAQRFWRTPVKEVRKPCDNGPGAPPRQAGRKDGKAKENTTLGTEVA